MENDLIKTARRAVKNWWTSLIVGVLSIGLGIIFILNPLNALLTLSIFFVAGFFASGLSEIIFAVSNRKTIDAWGWVLVSGIIDILLAIMLLFIPIATPLLMVYFIGFWVMFQSIWAIGVSFDLRKMKVGGWGWLLTLAVLGIIFSFIFIMSPVFASGFIVVTAAIAFMIYGIFRIYLAFKLRSFKKEFEEQAYA